MKRLKIDWEDVVKFIERAYDIKNVRFMRAVSGEGDCDICELPDYIQGDLD